jgi:hypothetical protein
MIADQSFATREVGSMRIGFSWFFLFLLVPAAAHAQRPDTIPPPIPADSAAADSLQLMRELEGALADTARSGAGPINPRLLPDISAVGDLIGDFSPERSTQPDDARFAVREVEVAIQAAVDPYFRGDVFLGISPEEGIAIEQAFLTTTGLPYGLEARLGRFLMPFGKQNQTHRHDLHAFEYPYVIQRFLGEEGMKGTGVSLSKLFAPFGFYQELQLSAVDQLGEADEELHPDVPATRRLAGMGYQARLRNYWDFSESTNLELGASALTSRRPVATAGFDDFNAVNARQSTLGADLTFRWRPLQEGLYRSLILQGEVMRQLNERSPTLPAGVTLLNPARDYTGAYFFGRWQLSRRLFLGGRYDWLEDAELDGSTLQATSADLEFFPSEFTKLLVSYEHRFADAFFSAPDRILLQATFSLGPHKPHPF